MVSRSKNKLNELQTIISKMSIESCCNNILPEFGVRWKEVSKAVRSARLPMIPRSVAKILCRHVANTLPSEEVNEIVARLTLKFEATRKRTWHMLKLTEQITDEPVNILTRVLPSRVIQALRNFKRSSNMEPEVHAVMLDDLIYISIQMVSRFRCSSKLIVAAVPNEPVAFANCVEGTLLNACVQGLGYNAFEDVCLNGQDLYSLLEIYNSNRNEQPDYLTEPPSCIMLYVVVSIAGLTAELTIMITFPKVTRNGIDFTYRAQIERCATEILGSAPSLNKLTVTAERGFIDSDRLTTNMKCVIEIKSENIAQTLLLWAIKHAILPNSDLFQIFYKLKSNKIHIK